MTTALEQPKAGLKPWEAGGPSPNPGGRPPTTGTLREVVELVRANSVPIVQRLIDIATDPRSNPAAAVPAAKILLDRGYGCAPQIVHLTGDVNQDVKRIIIERAGEPAPDALPLITDLPRQVTATVLPPAEHVAPLATQIQEMKDREAKRHNPPGWCGTPKVRPPKVDRRKA